MVSSREVESKVLSMAIQFEYYFFLQRSQGGKMVNVMLENLDGFFLVLVLCSGVATIIFKFLNNCSYTTTQDSYQEETI